MIRSRALTALATAALSATLLVGCGDNAEDEVRIAEPVLDFPQTSTTVTPTPTTTEEETTTEETETEETTTSTSTSSSTSSTRSSTSSTRSSTSSRSASRSSGSGGSNNEPAPQRPAAQPAQPSQPGAACAWPTQGANTGNQEYSTFCDREWARTVTPSDNQDFYWIAQGNGWVSIDPAGYTDDGPCWHRDDFADAPEAIKGAVAYCPGT